MQTENTNPFIGTPIEGITGNFKIKFGGKEYEAEIMKATPNDIDVWNGTTLICTIRKNHKDIWICSKFFGETKMQAEINIQEIEIL